MNSEEPFTGNIKYFFDTYALVEIFESNQAYSKYINKPFFITILNFFELHQYLLRVGNEFFADEKAETYIQHIQEITPVVTLKASKLRKQHGGKNMSMTDCIGYIYAKENGLLFLTGDSAFESMENVEFVK